MAQPASPRQPDTAPPPATGPLPGVPAPLLPAVPTTILTLAALHRLRQQALARRLTVALRRLWTQVVPGQAKQSWDASVGAQAVAVFTAVQAEATRGVQDYVAAAVTRWGAVSDPAGRVNQAAFAGVAADGRPLASLLSYPAFEADALVDQGLDPGTAAAIGQRHLERIAVTEVQDAARVATGVAMVTDRTVRVWVRMLTPPSCSRCVVLAGKVYQTAAGAGFQRHPLCDCVAIPGVEHLPDLATDPGRYFTGLTEPEQDATFTAAGAQAIRDGADISQVVNARRGMSKAASGRLTTANVVGRAAHVTREGTTSRGFAGQRLGKGGIRLMPEQIYLDAQGSRDEAIRLLRLYGYIV